MQQQKKREKLEIDKYFNYIYYSFLIISLRPYFPLFFLMAMVSTTTTRLTNFFFVLFSLLSCAFFLISLSFKQNNNKLIKLETTPIQIATKTTKIYFLLIIYTIYYKLSINGDDEKREREKREKLYRYNNTRTSP